MPGTSWMYIKLYIGLTASLFWLTLFKASTTGLHHILDAMLVDREVLTTIMWQQHSSSSSTHHNNQNLHNNQNTPACTCALGNLHFWGTWNPLASTQNMVELQQIKMEISARQSLGSISVTESRTGIFRWNSAARFLWLTGHNAAASWIICEFRKSKTDRFG